MRWTLTQVAGTLGAAVGAGLDPLARMAGVSIDSRTLRAGELFLAIRGPRHNGHEFVGAVLDRGAMAAVVARAEIGRYPEEVLARCLVVEDTFRALQQLGRTQREAWGRRIAGVTGSVGKTSTKEILAALLGAKFRVLKSEGNFNNEYGLPLTLCRLEEEHEAAVLEMGMSRRGELARLAAVARPDVAVVTRVTPAHLEFFSSVEEIALAKRELVEGLNGPGSVAVLNTDDPRVAAFAPHAPGRVLTYGVEQPAEFRAEGIEDRGALGTVFTYVAAEERARLSLPLAGRHQVANAVGALAAASVWGIGAKEAQQIFPLLHAAAMRGELMRFDDGAAVIDDSYNSSPVALAAAIDLLAATPNFRRRILAAGEMRELGAASAELHREAGRAAARSGKVDWIFTVEGDAERILEAAVEAGHPRAQSAHFASSEEAGEFLAGFFAAGDLMLVKGSRGVRMERIVEALLARRTPEKASQTGARP